MLYPIINNYRNYMKLDGIWEIKFDPENAGEKKGWNKGKIPGTFSCAVPGSYNEQFNDYRYHMKHVWYVTRFNVPVSEMHRSMILRFAGVTYRAKAWLNGRYIGSHEIGHLAFELDCTSKINFGGQNVLVLKTDNILSETTLPSDGVKKGHWAPSGDKFPPMSADYFPWGGITYSVYLAMIPKRHIHDITVRTDIKGRTGIVKCEAIVNSSKINKISFSIGKASVDAKVKERKATATLRIEKAKFWSPDSPDLYDLTVRAFAAGAQVDEYVLPIGIRTFEVKGLRLLLNGKQVNLRGFSRHEEYPLVGHGVHLSATIKDFQLLKWIGANSIRTAHYPNCDEVFRIADRVGIMVIEEAPAVSLFIYSPVSKMKHPNVPAKLVRTHLNALCEMYRRDKNHPSIVMWSVANECATTTPKTARYWKRMYEHMKELDPTRPVIISGSCGPDDRAHRDAFDLVSVHFYMSRQGGTGSMKKVAEGAHNLVDEIHRKYPDRPIIINEFGAGGISGMHLWPPEYFSEDYQREFYRLVLDIFEKKPFIVGVHPWCFADFKTQEHTGRVLYNHKGVFTRDRQPKSTAFMIKERWSKEKRDDILKW